MFLIGECGEGSPLDGTFSDNKGPYKEPDVKNQSVGTHNGWREALKENSVRSWKRAGLAWEVLKEQILHFSV